MSKSEFVDRVEDIFCEPDFGLERGFALPVLLGPPVDF
jgi:hypothetical protein